MDMGTYSVVHNGTDGRGTAHSIVLRECKPHVFTEQLCSVAVCVAHHTASNSGGGAIWSRNVAAVANASSLPVRMGIEHSCGHTERRDTEDCGHRNIKTQNNVIKYNT